MLTIAGGACQRLRRLGQESRLLAQVLRHARITPTSCRQGARWLSRALRCCLSRDISRMQGVQYLAGIPHDVVGEVHLAP